MGDLVVWEGEGGQVYMFQSELPYKYAEYKGVGYHVAANVKEHTVLGGGVYGIGRLYPIPVGIRLPSSARAKIATKAPSLAWRPLCTRITNSAPNPNSPRVVSASGHETTVV